MTNVLCLLAIQGLLGAFDTLYYHEYRARLPALGRISIPELRLHAARDFVYCIIFSTLAWSSWQGIWALVLFLLLAVEIVITLSDFVVEDSVRKPLGGVFKGERVTHAVMGIVYGAMLAYLLPLMRDWFLQPSALERISWASHRELSGLLTFMAVGVLISGIRDLYAALDGAGCGWPWPQQLLSQDEGD